MTHFGVGKKIMTHFIMTHHSGETVWTGGGNNVGGEAEAEKRETRRKIREKGWGTGKEKSQ